MKSNCRSFDSSLHSSLSDCLVLSRIIDGVDGKDGAMRLGKRQERVSRFATTAAAARRMYLAAIHTAFGVVASWQRTCRALALSRTSSLCATAMRTTLGGFP